MIADVFIKLHIYLANFFTADECNQIIDTNADNLEEGTVNGNDTLEGQKAVLKLRKSKVKFLTLDSPCGYLLKKMADRVKDLAEIYYQTYLSSFEAIQLAEYNKNNFYNWHTDATGAIDSHIQRDISASLILSKKSDYTGGSLQFVVPEKISDSNIITPKDVEEQGQGTLIMFPSTLIHRVDKVLSGTRHSLVLWSRSTYKPY